MSDIVRVHDPHFGFEPVCSAPVVRVHDPLFGFEPVCSAQVFGPKRFLQSRTLILEQSVLYSFRHFFPGIV